MDITSITAQNPSNNSTLAQAHSLQSQIKATNLSANPRIYGDSFVLNGFAVPENSTQDNSDIAQSWAFMNYDGSTTLQSLGVSENNPPVCLVIQVAEGADANGVNLVNVAEALRDMAGGATLKQVCNLS